MRDTAELGHFNAVLDLYLMQRGRPGVITTHAHVAVIQVKVGVGVRDQLIVVFCTHQTGYAVPAGTSQAL